MFETKATDLNIVDIFASLVEGHRVGLMPTVLLKAPNDVKI